MHTTGDNTAATTLQPVQKERIGLIGGLTWWRVHAPWFSWILSRKFHLDSLAVAAGGNVFRSCRPLQST